MDVDSFHKEGKEKGNDKGKGKPKGKSKGKCKQNEIPHECSLLV